MATRLVTPREYHAAGYHCDNPTLRYQRSGMVLTAWTVRLILVHSGRGESDTPPSDE